MRQWIGSFSVGFCLTLCVLGLAGSCLWIEHNLQETTRGQAEPSVAYTLEAGRLRLYRTADGKTLELSPALREHLLPLLPIPLQGMGRMLQQESVGLERMLDWVEGLLAGDTAIGSRRAV